MSGVAGANSGTQYIYKDLWKGVYMRATPAPAAADTAPVRIRTEGPADGGTSRATVSPDSASSNRYGGKGSWTRRR